MAERTPQLVIDRDHLDRVVLKGILTARSSVAIMTADFKAMLVPEAGAGRSRGRSIVHHFVELAQRGVEVRVLHAGVPSGPALKELHRDLPANLRIRRCPRLHAKAVVIDAEAVYLGSANLTGAGLGAKSATRRNFEMGIWSRSSELVDQVLGQFDALWEGDCCEGCGRRDVCPVPLEEPVFTKVTRGVTAG